MERNSSHTPAQARELEQILRGHITLYRAVGALSALHLPDCWVGAGAVAQTVWNHLHGYPPGQGIADVDIVYFDPDLSREKELRIGRAVRDLLSDLPWQTDVTNEARVHLWYGEIYGREIPPYRSSALAISSWPCPATAIGVATRRGVLEICAPLGLADLLAGIIRPNKALCPRHVYQQKCARWKANWPGLTVLSWD